jgi:23S rRNA pseudouridine2605 synthase/16S rRNA pseudouridine516 synthase
VRGRVTPQVVQQLKQGVELEDGLIRADRARVLQQQADDRHSMVELTLHSGRNRIVRRMLDAVGHPVVELVRRSFGPLNLGTLRSGAMRELTKVELGQLLTISRAADAARGGGSGSNEGDS